MSPRELAHWMREEHQQVEVLASQLRQKLVTRAQGPRAQWLTDVKTGFEKFREHFSRHIRLEEEGGYLDAVLERQPNTSREVEKLRHEHDEFVRLLDSIRVALTEVAGADELLAHDCCVRMQVLLAAIDRHEQDENLIVSLVFTRDMGSTD